MGYYKDLGCAVYENSSLLMFVTAHYSAKEDRRGEGQYVLISSYLIILLQNVIKYVKISFKIDFVNKISKDKPLIFLQTQ